MTLASREAEAAPRATENPRLPDLDGVDESTRLVGGEEPERRQPLAVASEADRDDRHRRHLGVQRDQVEDGALEPGAVVEIRAEHDLGVHADAGLAEPLQARQGLGAPAGPAPPPVAQLR